MSAAAPDQGVRTPPLWQRALPWMVTLLCFAWLGRRISGAAARQGVSAHEYLFGVFTTVPWHAWLGLMIPYSVLFFLVDATVVWRVVNWFNARVPFVEILPIRASAYIISILNEQVGKGAMALYLNRRHGVPGWEVGSSMLFIMFCELLYLTFWALVGYWIAGDDLPPQFRLVPWVALGVLVLFAVWVAYFRGAIAPGSKLRDKPILKAFREAGPLHYVAIAALRSPAILTAVVVYTLALRLFGVTVSFIDMLGILPLIFATAAAPIPMRAGPIILWAVLFPERQAEISAFGFVMHNFFIFFNATIGLLFMGRAKRELLATR
jgi:hypothetical protein